MAKQDTLTYKGLISSAKQLDYYASVTTGESSKYWADQARQRRDKAEAIPDDFVDPKFEMPEWGTRGT
jgi:hypothetical protein